MKIWIINQYNSLPKHGHLNRHFNFAKGLKKLGHEPVLFLGSSPHNTDLQLVAGKARYAIDEEAGFATVLVRAVNYNHSMGKRIRSMIEFYRNVLKCAGDFERPDVIIGSSAHPLNCVAAIKLAKRYGCPCVCEVRDLWPESIVAYGVAGRRNPVVQMLYRLEKWIYKKADALIFTMEGGRDYILDKGWDSQHGGPIDLQKVYHINNGVDLAQFEREREANRCEDKDLEDAQTFKVVYTGSLRRANNMDMVLEVAEKLKGKPIKFLIWGDGTERERLKERCRNFGLDNVLFKGRVPKEQVPSIVSRADLSFFILEDSEIFRYGLSLNKCFDYMAAGKPVLIVGKAKYMPPVERGCAIQVERRDAQKVADAIEQAQRLPRQDYEKMCQNALAGAKEYDFMRLTEKLLEVCDKAFKNKARQKKTGEQGV